MKTNVNLKPYNSFGFNATAKYFVEINDANDLQRLFRMPEFKKEQHLILGGGNNILLTKEFFNGMVIYINNKGIKTVAERTVEKLPAPYFPVITAGWDATPRTIQSDIYRKGDYPFTAIMDTDCEAFRKQFSDLAGLLRNRPEADRVVFFNAWNEWTEGSYLEPDTFNKYKLLEIIKEEKQRYHGN